MWPFRKRKSKVSSARNILPGVIRAKYDAAQTTFENRRHWFNADNLSADQANSLEVRSTLRTRARYEIANNSYAKGIITTLANDCIGTGPKLQVLTEDVKLNRQIEQAFSRWSKLISLPQKLRTMRMAKASDGEAFGILTRNPILNFPIELDLKLIEADRVSKPICDFTQSKNEVDGIKFDRWSNPVSYTILRYHPGDCNSYKTEFDIADAKSVIHYFRVDRPGQHRGVPEITSAIALFAQLRRYTLAVLAAAETAADFAAVLYTDSPANGEATSIAPMDLVALEKRMATTLPNGWKLGQLKAEQPSTSYSEFKREILNEIARCLNIPYNIAACNSSGYNYASGRLDHQTYYKSIRVEQSQIASVVLDKIFSAWIDEAMLTSEFSALRNLNNIPHQWFFDGTEHVDPVKEAKAQSVRLKSNTTTLAAEFAKQGKDWETELHQRSKETKLLKQLNLIESNQSENKSTPEKSYEN